VNSGPLPVSLIASDTAIKAPLEPAKLVEGIRQGGCEIGGRLAIQCLDLDQPGTHSRVPCGLGVVVQALATGSVAAWNRQSSESRVVHDHIRHRQHQIAAVTCIVVGIGARHVKHAGKTESR
jgi:hypothetical protein